MEALVINRQLLPEPIISFIHSENVRVSKEKDRVVLSPVRCKTGTSELFGMFNDGKLSVEKFLKERSENWEY